MISGLMIGAAIVPGSVGKLVNGIDGDEKMSLEAVINFKRASPHPLQPRSGAVSLAVRLWSLKKECNPNVHRRNRGACGVRRVLAAFLYSNEKRRELATLHTVLVVALNFQRPSGQHWQERCVA